MSKVLLEILELEPCKGRKEPDVSEADVTTRRSAVAALTPSYAYAPSKVSSLSVSLSLSQAELHPQNIQVTVLANRRNLQISYPPGNH